MNPVIDASSRGEKSGHKIYVIAGLISWQPFSSKRIRIGPCRDYFSFFFAACLGLARVGGSGTVVLVDLKTTSERRPA